MEVGWRTILHHKPEVVAKVLRYRFGLLLPSPGERGAGALWSGVIFEEKRQRWLVTHYGLMASH
jgi:hypothetical protein